MVLGKSSLVNPPGEFPPIKLPPDNLPNPNLTLDGGGGKSPGGIDQGGFSGHLKNVYSKKYFFSTFEVSRIIMI